jgi:hypothetical protein
VENQPVIEQLIETRFGPEANLAGYGVFSSNQPR